jgi:hypothetical protein
MHIYCRILGKHHTPKMGGGGGDLSLYRPDKAWSTSNTIQGHIQHYMSNTRPQSQVDLDKHLD